MEFDLVEHLKRQKKFSLEAFGPESRAKGIIDHIRKELIEIEESPKDLKEWVDVVLLALDGAWRAGYEPEDIALAISVKQGINEKRDWPDWRSKSPDEAILHKKEASNASQD